MNLFVADVFEKVTNFQNEWIMENGLHFSRNPWKIKDTYFLQTAY